MSITEEKYSFDEMRNITSLWKDSNDQVEKNMHVFFNILDLCDFDLTKDYLVVHNSKIIKKFTNVSEAGMFVIMSLRQDCFIYSPEKYYLRMDDKNIPYSDISLITDLNLNNKDKLYRIIDNLRSIISDLNYNTYQCIVCEWIDCVDKDWNKCVVCKNPICEKCTYRNKNNAICQICYNINISC